MAGAPATHDQSASSLATPFDKHKWLAPLARFGYGARGVVYLLIGGFALVAAVSFRGESTDAQGALSNVLSVSGGWFPVLLISVMKRHYRNIRNVIGSLYLAMRWLGAHELPTLICLALVACGMWAFAELADEVLEGTTQDMDTAILVSMRNPDDLSDPVGPKWFEELARDVTALGSVGVLTGLTLAVAGYWALHRRPATVTLLLVAVVGGFAMSQLLKNLFERARPDLVPHGSHVYTASFPSGHAMVSAATYLTLGTLLARIESRRHVKAYLLLLSMLLTVVVGCSRVYLGVHWPTDVLAGWTLGACWALICWGVAWRWQRSDLQWR